MPYPETIQKKTGHPTEISTNQESRYDGNDGTDGGQPTTGHLSKDSPPLARKGSGDYGIGGGQKSKGVSSEISANPGNHSQSGRIDKIEEITN